MKRILRIGLFLSMTVMCAATAFADVLKGVFPEADELKDNMAVLYFDGSKRLDLSILAEFIQDCSKFRDVACICAESSDMSDEKIASEFKGAVEERCLYRGETSDPLPQIEFVKDGNTVGTIEKGGNFAGMTSVYLSYLAGDITEKGLNDKLKEAESAEEFKKIVPRMQFVLMLARKGAVDSAINELDKISGYNLDEKSRLMVGETYLRLKAPEKAIIVLEKCSSNECRYYTGVAQYLSGDMDTALETLKSLRGSYSDLNKLNYFIKKIYEAKGDMKHADEIRLPENYNIDSD